MGSVLQRALFWRVYLTLLGSLVATALLGSFIWHVMTHPPSPEPQPMPGRPEKRVAAPGEALAALLPPDGAAQGEIDAALRRVSAASGARVVLFDRQGRPAGAAVDGRDASSEAWTRGGANMHVLLDRLGPWRLPAGGGRTIWIERPQRPTRAGVNMGEHMLLMLLTVAALIGLAAYPVVSRLTRRLETLRSSLDAWGDGRLSIRAEVEGADEVAAVAKSFNAAADRVELLLRSHKSLLAHASHELRSPLTRLRLAVEMLVSRPDPELKPGIERDIAELDALVDEILLASRLDQTGASAPAAERVDLLALCAEEAARGQARLSHPPSAEGAFEVLGSPRLLRRLIRNLVENAAKHGAPPVDVELDRLGGQIVIRVLDRGAGIPEAERERVFEPFYRPAGWSESAGSWGLGLSIVRQIVQRHGGGVTCESRPGGGACFQVRLPIDAG